MKKFFTKIKSRLPSKRRLIQLYAALLFNANIKGFINGTFYKGPSKYLCTPGLNCYSCPGAVGSCPLGSLQNALYNSDKTMIYYTVGIILLYGLFFGRWICGFLCPFGLIQDLLHKIKTPKLKKSRATRVLSYFKYVLLVFLGILVPLIYAAPGFCKYICPAGTLGGAVGLLLNNDSLYPSLGPLFTWKFVLLVIFVVASVFIYRFFCRFFCPLGALLGLFNRFALFGIKVDQPKCTNCGLCTATCKMDIRRVGDHECINCGECVDICPTKAITWKGSKIFLRENEIPMPENADAETVKEVEVKRTATIKKRKNILQSVVAVIMAGLLSFALIFYNVIEKDEAPAEGYEVGSSCYGYDLETFDESGLLGNTFNPAENFGKITVINFWGTWCPGCIAELPYFDRIANEYKDSVTVVAIHTDYVFDTAPGYVEENFPDSNMIFAKDVLSDPNDPYSSDHYYTSLGGQTDAYPMTVVLDDQGVVIAHLPRELTYEEIKEIIEKELNNLDF